MLYSLLSSCEKTPKDICLKGTNADEQILYVLRAAFITNVPWILLAIFFLFIPNLVALLDALDIVFIPHSFPTAFGFVLTMFWYLFVFGFVLVNFTNWFFNTYVITTTRIIDIDVHGILYRNVSEAFLTDVEDLKHSMSGLFPTLLNFGDVVIQTAGERREFEFHHVSDPIKVQDIISDLIKETKTHARTN